MKYKAFVVLIEDTLALEKLPTLPRLEKPSLVDVLGVCQDLIGKGFVIRTVHNFGGLVHVPEVKGYRLFWIYWS